MTEDYETPPELLTDLDSVRHHIDHSDWPNKPLCRGLVARLAAAQSVVEDLEGALRRIANGAPRGCGTTYMMWDPSAIARDALASLPSPEPTQPTTECAFPDCDCPGEFPVCEDFPAHLRNPLDPHGTAPEPTQQEDG